RSPLHRARRRDRAHQPARDRRDRNIASREWLSWTHLIFGRTVKAGTFLAGFEAGLQSDSDAREGSHSGARASANPESRAANRINNLGIPDPALRAGPERRPHK